MTYDCLVSEDCFSFVPLWSPAGKQFLPGDSTPAEPLFTIAVGATAAPQGAAVPFDFGQVPIQTSKAQVFTITNSGNSEGVLQGVTSADLTVTALLSSLNSDTGGFFKHHHRALHERHDFACIGILPGHDRLQSDSRRQLQYNDGCDLRGHRSSGDRRPEYGSGGNRKNRLLANPRRKQARLQRGPCLRHR